MSDITGNTVTVKAMMGDVVIMETDKELLVEFYKRSVLNPAKSREAQTPVYENRDYCRIIRPGEPHSVWDQEVRQIDKMRFEAQWKAYESNMSQEVSGTPLDILFPDNPAIVASFRAVHVRTIQQLAQLSDNAIGNIPFGHDHREAAKKFIAATKKSNEELAEMTEKHEKEMAALTEQVAALTAQLASKPKRGRPPKAQAQE